LPLGNQLRLCLGVVPLAVATGASSASRHSVGTGVSCGMPAATFLAVLFVPLFFRLVTRERKRAAEVGPRPAETAGKAEALSHS